VCYCLGKLLFSPGGKQRAFHVPSGVCCEKTKKESLCDTRGNVQLPTRSDKNKRKQSAVRQRWRSPWEDWSWVRGHENRWWRKFGVAKIRMEARAGDGRYLPPRVVSPQTCSRSFSPRIFFCGLCFQSVHLFFWWTADQRPVGTTSCPLMQMTTDL